MRPLARRARRTLLFAFGVATALLVLSPLLWVAFASLAPEHTLFRADSSFPTRLSLEHYRNLFTERGFGLPLRNSLIVASATTALCLAIGSLAAYALARLEFRGRTPTLGLLLAVSAFPQISVVQPLYSILRELGLMDSFPGLVLSYVSFALPITVLLLVSYFRELPREVEAAAQLDGATTLQVFRHVVLPLSMPGLVATGIISFIYCWNEFLFALSFTVRSEHQTLPVAIAMLRGRHQIPWGELFASAIITVLPVAGLVLLFQRRILHGLTSAGHDPDR